MTYKDQSNEGTGATQRAGAREHEQTPRGDPPWAPGASISEKRGTGSPWLAIGTRAASEEWMVEVGLFQQLSWSRDMTSRRPRACHWPVLDLSRQSSRVWLWPFLYHVWHACVCVDPDSGRLSRRLELPLPESQRSRLALHPPFSCLLSLFPTFY